MLSHLKSDMERVKKWGKYQNLRQLQIVISQARNKLLTNFQRLQSTAIHVLMMCVKTRRKVLKVAKGWAKVEKINYESTLDEYSWWVLLMSILDEYSWWVLLMSTFDKYSWWVLFMTTLDDSWCLIWNYHYGRTNGRTDGRTDIAISRVVPKFKATSNCNISG